MVGGQDWGHKLDQCNTVPLPIMDVSPGTPYACVQGARVASQCANDNADKVPGVVFSSYPLHPPGKQVGLSHWCAAVLAQSSWRGEREAPPCPHIVELSPSLTCHPSSTSSSSTRELLDDEESDGDPGLRRDRTSCETSPWRRCSCRSCSCAARATSSARTARGRPCGRG